MFGNDMNSTSTHGNLRPLLRGYKQVIYTNNPLAEVLLQIRFPKFLRLQKEDPSSFQERIISQYPHYSIDERFEVRPSSGEAAASVVEQKVHRFVSTDKYWRVSIASDFIAISTKEYEDWQSFKNRAYFCFDAFFKEYPIKLVTRLGLRYRNVIMRSKIGLDGKPWSSLINPILLGPMGEDGFQSVSFENANWSHRFTADEIDEVKVLFQGGLQVVEREQSYLLDCDTYLQKDTVIGDDKLDGEFESLHKFAGPLFRWAIEDELHESLGPKPPKD